MNRWKTEETRNQITPTESAYLRQELDRACRPQPQGGRLDPMVASWKWAYRWIQAMSLHKLKIRVMPASHREVQRIVYRYYTRAFD